MNTISDIKIFSIDLCKKFSEDLFYKVFKFVLIPFQNEDISIQKKHISSRGRRKHLINFMKEKFEDLEFNPYQIAITTCYADKFLSRLSNKGYDFNYIFIKSILILSIIATHKMTSDNFYSTPTLEKYFQISNLGELENEYYALIDYRLFVSQQLAIKYLALLLENTDVLEN